MNTITMTFRQLSQSVCYRRQIYGGWTCVRYFMGAKRCCKSNCPIWKRAEKRTEKLCRFHKNCDLRKGVPCRGPDALCWEIDKEKPSAELKLRKRTVKLITRIEQAHKDAAKSKLVFGPSTITAGGGVVQYGRSGTPLVKDGKIVRFPKKQTHAWCCNCRTKQHHRIGNTGELICQVCGYWRVPKEPVKSCQNCGWEDSDCGQVMYYGRDKANPCNSWKPRRK